MRGETGGTRGSWEKETRASLLGVGTGKETPPLLGLRAFKRTPTVEIVILFAPFACSAPGATACGTRRGVASGLGSKRNVQVPLEVEA